MSSSGDIWSEPAGKPPAGLKSDFNSPENSGPLFFAVSSVVMALAIICCSLRLYVRFFVQKQPWWDDLCMVLALALQITYTAITDNLALTGGFRHQWDMSLGKLEQVFKVQDTLGTIQMPTYLFTKLALFLLYYRLFSPKRAFKWAIFGGCAVITCSYIPFMFLFIFEDNYAVLIPMSYGLACINLITDVYLWVLPVAAVSSLNLPPKRKIGLAAIFSLGLLSVAMSTVSLTYRYNILKGSNDLDQTYPFSARTAVVIVEIYVGIIVGCVPMFPGVVRKTPVSAFFSRTFQSLRSRLVSMSQDSKIKRVEGGSSQNSNSHPYRTITKLGADRSMGTSDEVPLKPYPLTSTSEAHQWSRYKVDDPPV